MATMILHLKINNLTNMSFKKSNYLFRQQIILPVSVIAMFSWSCTLLHRLQWLGLMRSKYVMPPLLDRILNAVAS